MDYFQSQNYKTGIKSNPARLFSTPSTLKTSHTAKPSNPKFSLSGKLTPSHVASTTFKGVKYLHPQHPLLMKKSFDPIDPETKTILKAAIKQHGKEAVMKAVRENPAKKSGLKPHTVEVKKPDGITEYRLTYPWGVAAFIRYKNGSRVAGGHSNSLSNEKFIKWIGWVKKTRSNPATLEKTLRSSAKKLKLPLKRAKAYVYGTLKKIEDAKFLKKHPAGGVRKNPVVGGDKEFVHGAMLKLQQHGLSIPESMDAVQQLMIRIKKKQPGRHTLKVAGVSFHIFKK